MPAKPLQAEGITARVVSVPCLEWFNEQDAAYREAVLPAAVKARVSVEAGLALGWQEFVGDAGRSVSHRALRRLRRLQDLFQEFGITAEAVAAAAKESLAGLPALIQPPTVPGDHCATGPRFQEL